MIQAVLLWVSLLVHPFHISVCELVYADESDTFEISCRIFMDDLELALTQRTRVQNYFETRNSASVNRDLADYLLENLTLHLDNKPARPEFIGFEIEEDVVWCYLEVKEVGNLKDLTLNYRVLHETYDDQINLTHINYLGQIKSLRFSKGSTSRTIEF